MKHTSTIVALSLLGALALPAGAQPSSESKMTAASAPGQATVTRTHKVTATVEAIDAAKRDVTLKGPGGKLHQMTVGPEVRNLDQIKVGDSVVVGYHEALSLTLMKGGKELRGSSQAASSARAEVGEKPGGAAAEQVKVTADVTAVNAKTQTVTLRGPKQVVDLHVRDPQQFKMIKVGDQIDAVYSQALAVSVEPAKK